MVIANCLGFGALIAHEKLGVPLATVHIQPAVILSRIEPPAFPGVVGPRWLKGLINGLAERLVIDRTVCPEINRFRQEVGLSPVQQIVRWWHSPQLVVCTFPEWFASPQPDWPRNLVQTGFPLWDERTDAGLAGEVQEFLDAGEPPIVFTPGSANVFGREFFQAASEACQRLGRRGILLIIERRPPPRPNLSMKGRNPNTLLRQVERWHRQLANESADLKAQWPNSGIGPFDWIEGRESRHPRAAIQAIADKRLASSDLTSPYLVLISDAFASPADSTRDAFLRLLLHVQGCTSLLSVEPVVRQFGTQPGNNFVDALAALARHHESWLRPLELWAPRTHNPRRQFCLLARHLLAKYPVPVFMDSVWFKGQTPEGLRQQQWFWQIGNGKSPRQLDLPIRFTKRMVHHFLRAPSDYTVEAAFRWAQVLALGGTARLVEAVLGSKLATDFSHEEFWESVIRWLIANPMLDTAQVGPIVDYIHHQKFEAQQAEPNARPLQPDFSIQGRTPQTILRQMQEWYGELRKEPQQQTQVTWYESGIGEFEWIEGAATPENRQHWTIKEILTRKDLFGEGSAMRHCVASYEHSCASGHTSIWSMGMERREGRRKRVLTVEVAADRKTICQVRGKANRLPTAKEMDILRQWARQEGLTVADGVSSR